MISQYWEFYIGGAAIAFVAVGITLLTGRFLSVTRGYVSACSIISKKSYFNDPQMGGKFGFRTFFSIGLVVGGLTAGLYASGFDLQMHMNEHVNWGLGNFDTLFGTSLWIKAGVLGFGGFLWGYGSRMAGGCTSGNAISGVSRGSHSSIAAAACFIVGGAAITFILKGVLG